MLSSRNRRSEETPSRRPPCHEARGRLAGTDGLPAAAGNRAFLEFYEYWRHKAAGKVMPSRADLDPLEIPQLLPGIFLVDVVRGSPRRFRFRLVGTRIAELEGEMTNRFLDEFIPSSPGTAMARQYEDASEGRIHVRRETLRWQTRDRQHINYDVLLLPLSRDGATIDMLFGLCVYRVK